MKKLSLITSLLFFTLQGICWGQNGHRVVGKIAESYLSEKARKNIEQILGPLTLAEVSTYMDEIKSYPEFDHMKPWHYCTIPDGRSYQQAGTPEDGDVIVTINRLISELKSKDFTDRDESFALKCLVHLVGDIHQPLHVGNGEDRGGNDSKVVYFSAPSNLHRVWDTQMIESQNYSYTEYADWINHASAEKAVKWQNTGVLEWANESKSYRGQVYDLPEDGKISYRYTRDNIALVNLRLLQAGVRLAGVLNEIYG